MYKICGMWIYMHHTLHVIFKHSLSILRWDLFNHFHILRSSWLNLGVQAWAKLGSQARNARRELTWLPSLGQCWHPRAKELTGRQAWDMLGPSLAPKSQDCQGYPILGQGWPKNSMLAGLFHNCVHYSLQWCTAATKMRLTSNSEPFSCIGPTCDMVLAYSRNEESCALILTS